MVAIDVALRSKSRHQLVSALTFSLLVISTYVCLACSMLATEYSTSVKFLEIIEDYPLIFGCTLQLCVNRRLVLKLEAIRLLINILRAVTASHFDELFARLLKDDLLDL